MNERTMTIKEKAQKIARSLKKENPDYYYLKELFKNIRNELNIKVEKQPKHLPYVPTEEGIKRYYKVVFESENMQKCTDNKNTNIYRSTSRRVGKYKNRRCRFSKLQYKNK